MHRQRSLDRCLVRTLETRCSHLNALSNSNRELKRIAHFIALAEMAKKLGSLVPIAGQIAAAMGEASIDWLRLAARAIAWKQDNLLARDQFTPLLTLSCGTPPSSWTPDMIGRGFSAEADLAGVPAPLEWRVDVSSTLIEIGSFEGRTVSFGWCRPSSGESRPSLEGESYAIRIDRPTTANLRTTLQNLADSLLSKLFSS